MKYFEMKSFTIAILASTISGRDKIPRRLDTNLGLFVDDEQSNNFVKPYHGTDLATALGT